MPRDKKSAKGSNFKEEDRALPLYRSYYSMGPPIVFMLRNYFKVNGKPKKNRDLQL